MDGREVIHVTLKEIPSDRGGYSLSAFETIVPDAERERLAERLAETLSRYVGRRMTPELREDMRREIGRFFESIEPVVSYE